MSVISVAIQPPWPEADDELTDRETVIIELMDGQYGNPVRVVASNTAEGWMADVSTRRGARNLSPQLKAFNDQHRAAAAHVPVFSRSSRGR
jgi:hypothetical protein